MQEKEKLSAVGAVLIPKEYCGSSNVPQIDNPNAHIRNRSNISGRAISAGVRSAVEEGWRFPDSFFATTECRAYGA